MNTSFKTLSLSSGFVTITNCTRAVLLLAGDVVLMPPALNVEYKLLYGDRFVKKRST
jgi:hypothetical protein